MAGLGKSRQGENLLSLEMKFFIWKTMQTVIFVSKFAPNLSEHVYVVLY